MADNRRGLTVHGDCENRTNRPFGDPQALLTRPIADLGLSVRAWKCTMRLGLRTVGDLIQRTPRDLLKCKNFGLTSLNEVSEKLAALGLQLRDDSTDDDPRSPPLPIHSPLSIRLSPKGIDRLLGVLKLNIAGQGLPSDLTEKGDTSSTPRLSPSQVAQPEPVEGVPLSRRMTGNPPSEGTVSQWPGRRPAAPMPIPIVSAKERNAVFKALDEAGRPLITWQIVAKCPGISQRRMEELLPLLVHEKTVKRVEAANGVRYSRR